MDLFQDPEFQALIQEFLSQLATRRERILEARHREDWTEVATHAHKIAGCAESYGFGVVGTLARECEKKIRGPESVRSMGPDLQAQLEALDSAIVEAVMPAQAASFG